METDDRLTLASAEGIDIDLHLAGLGSRSAALLIDLVVQTLTIWLVALIASQFGDAGVAIFSVASFLVFFGYPVIGEVFAGGRTVGKAWMRLVVVSADGTPVRFRASVIRNLVRLIDALPGVYTVGMVAILFSGRNQRVGDMAAGTLVLHKVRAHRPTAEGGIGGLVPPSTLPPDAATWDVAAVTADEVAALRTFLDRRVTLDPEHRARLAQSLAFQVMPKVAGVPLDGGPEFFIERVVAAKLGPR